MQESVYVCTPIIATFAISLFLTSHTLAPPYIHSDDIRTGLASSSLRSHQDWLCFTMNNKAAFAPELSKPVSAVSPKRKGDETSAGSRCLAERSRGCDKADFPPGSNNTHGISAMSPKRKGDEIAAGSRRLADSSRGCDKAALPFRSNRTHSVSATLTGMKGDEMAGGLCRLDERSRGCDEATFPTESNHTHGVSWIPKSKSASSKRIKAAYMAAEVHNNGSTKKNKRRKIQRSNKKEIKQRNHLIHVELPQSFRTFSQEETQENDIFVDGGDPLNTRITPKVLRNVTSSEKKPVIVKPLIVLKIADNDLYVPEHHLMDPTKGLTVFHTNNLTNQPKPFVLCPRINSLSSTAQLNNLDVTTALCDALDSIERAMTCSSKRGSQKHVIHDTTNKFIGCVGSQVRRAGTGVEPIHYTLKKVNIEHQKVIMSLFRQIEHLFEMFIDSEQVRQIKHAIDLINPCTFTIPGDERKHSDIYSALASVLNGYLVTHIDEDMTYGAITLHKRSAYQLTDKVVAYFNFPCLGISIPLRPGDVLFFNPREPHCISSRCNNADEIYSVSLYIKSNILGLNDNDRKLLPGEEKLVEEYNKKY